MLATVKLVGGKVLVGDEHAAKKAMRTQAEHYSESQQGALCAVREGLRVADESKAHRSLFQGYILHAQLGKKR